MTCCVHHVNLLLTQATYKEWLAEALLRLDRNFLVADAWFAVVGLDHVVYSWTGATSTYIYIDSFCMPM